MFYYGERSKNNLISAHPKLQELFEEVLRYYDHSILEGFRGKDRQQEFYQSGQSKVQFPHSQHNQLPSGAVDVAPYPREWNGEIDWDDRERWYHFAGYVKATADRLGIKVRWGGDWDGDMDLKDQNFFDLVHWELIK